MWSVDRGKKELESWNIQLAQLLSSAVRVRLAGAAAKWSGLEWRRGSVGMEKT